MNRRLLPYEYQLIEALGVSKEEYLEFVALQQEYKDPKAGTELDVRNGPAAGTVALVLTVVGTLFQVGAALLAPKPKLPDISGPDNQRRTRQQRFAPSSGFNSAPELASYGDPVSLVYTNKRHNPEGGVRVSGSLVWSSIDNYGSSQFIQLLFVLGAAQIMNLSHRRTAFGSLAIDQLDPATAFLFYKSEKEPGSPVFSDLKKGELNFYPESSNRSNQGNREVCQVITINNRSGRSGFSQAYSPTTSSSLGIYDPIPVKVDMITRDTKGEEQFAPVGVTLEKLDWTHQGFSYGEGKEIIVRFQSSDFTDGDDEAVPLAVNLRRQAVNALDFGSTYMLGSAKFRLISFGQHKDIEDGDVNATFKCVESGICPSALYDRELATQAFDSSTGKELDLKHEKKALEKHLSILKNNIDDDEEEPDDFSSPLFDDEADFLNDAQVEQVKQDSGDQYNRIGVKNDLAIGNRRIKYDFISDQNVKWINQLDEGKKLKIRTFGSIDYTKYLELEALANPPTIDSKDLKKELISDLKRARRTITELTNGEYDDSEVRLAVLGNKSLSQVIEEKEDEDKKPTSKKRSLYYQLNRLESKQQKNNKLRGVITKDLRKSLKLKTDSFKADSGGDATVTRVPSFADLKDKDTGGMSVQENIELEQDLEVTKAKIEHRRDVLASRARRPIIEQLESSSTSVFFSLPGSRNLNRYGFGGVEAMEDLLENFPTGKKIVDTDGEAAIELAFTQVKAAKQNAIRKIQSFLNDWDDIIAGIDNNFFVKALVKAESAAYETMSEVDQVKFSIKSKLFRRISGRQKKYGETKASKKYSRGDNGIHGRQAFFRFSYRKGSDTSFTVHPVLFSLRQSSESDAYNDFNFLAPSRDRYVFKFDPVYDVTSEHALNGQTTLVTLNSNESEKSTKNIGDSGLVWYKGSEQFPIKLEERGPRLTNEWDVFSVNTDTQVQFSLENGPELALTAVTEQQIQNTDGIYRNLSMLALSMFAGRNVQDLRNVTAFVEEGKKSYKVINFASPSDESTSYAPDIFVDTVLDTENGIGKYAPSAALDQAGLKLAKKFCKENNLPTHPENGVTPPKTQLFMDCVIADNSSWRDFWVTNAPFSLLEFARKNGRETLVPALPIRSNGKAAENDGRPIELTISALFTTGNILEDSYKEEFLDYGASTQDLIASVVYREEYTKAVFQRKRTVQIERKGNKGNTAIRETFDASGFITSRQQAILFGKMLVNQRRFIRRGVEFKTFPSSNPIEPGAFIYVDIGLNSWDRTSSGVIGAGGALNSPLQDSIPNGTYNFLIYNRDNAEVATQNSVTVSGGVASSLSNRVGRLYVMGIASNKKRVFRVTDVEMDEDGEVTVRAIEYPCDSEQRAHVADFRPDLFKVS